MPRAPLQYERIRADRAASILGIDKKTLRLMSDHALVPEAARIGGIYTYRDAALHDFVPMVEGAKLALIERLKPAREDRVYVIQCGYRVKIGFTSNLAQRFTTLKTGNHRTMSVLASWPAGRSEEKELHQRFADLRVRGEWFALKKPIKEWLRAEHGVEVR